MKKKYQGNKRRDKYKKEKRQKMKNEKSKKMGKKS